MSYPGVPFSDTLQQMFDFRLVSAFPIYFVFEHATNFLTHFFLNCELLNLHIFFFDGGLVFLLHRLFLSRTSLGLFLLASSSWGYCWPVCVTSLFCFGRWLSLDPATQSQCIGFPLVYFGVPLIFFYDVVHDSVDSCLFSFCWLPYFATLCYCGLDAAAYEFPDSSHLNVFHVAVSCYG